MSSNEIEEGTRAILAKGSVDTSLYFCRVVEEIDWETTEGLTEFCALCEIIGGAGWKSYESLDAYLEVARLLSHEIEILRVGRVCRKMSGYSFEPMSQYLILVAVVVRLQQVELLPSIEQVAVNYQERYQHASGLLTEFFVAAAHQLEKTDRTSFEDWLRAADTLASGHRNQIQMFFAESRRALNIDWQFFCSLLSNSREAASCYLEQTDSLQVLSSQLLRSSHELIEKYLSGQVVELITSLSLLTRLDEEGAHTILSMALKCPDAVTAALLIEHAQDLPLTRPTVIEAWLALGNSEAGGHAAVLEAWIGLESLKSVNGLENLLGTVRFEDHHRVFDLIAEAVSGRRMMLTTAESADEIRSDVVSFNGKDIFLPESVSRFDDQQENFDFYRVSLLHQIGFLEFGCFENISRVRIHLAEFSHLGLAELVFSAVENARVDWLLEHHYPGIRKAMATQKQRAWYDRNKPLVSNLQQLLEALIGIGLDARFELRVRDQLIALTRDLWSCFAPVRLPEASLDDSLLVTSHCYELIISYLHSSTFSLVDDQVDIFVLDEIPEPVAFRGDMDLGKVETTLKIEALLNEMEEALGDVKDTWSIGSGDNDQIDLSELIEGDVAEGASMTIEELSRHIDVHNLDLESASAKQTATLMGGIAAGKKEADVHRYDEWDYSINDYRSRWCTLFEYKVMEEDEEYFSRTLSENEALMQKIRHQLNRVRPEMLKKVRGFPEGEELDLESSVDFLVDRRARLTPDEKIYIQRRPKERDVATLFLLDMSASTDDIIAAPDKEPVIDGETEDEDRMMEYFQMRKAYEESARRIIDLEKQSVILMSESLENLGDIYSVCGFSGYGRERVDYYRFKGFDAQLDEVAKRRIGGMKPCRSTRMGAPIRHASRQLLETGSRIKALIMISDGYPQDHDYGPDRNSREYGLMDTMKALTEARQQGLLTYCLTVDPSGHDYLREMCPEGQYMVIQDIDQLPEELSRVYRSLTG